MDIYIDESGSISKYIKEPFIICVLVVREKEKLKRVFKRYIKKNCKYFKNNDFYKNMYTLEGSFKEIKGNLMTFNDKKEFISYFCMNNLFEIFYIKINNSKLYDSMLDNVNMTFNYCIRLFLEKQLLKIYKENNINLNIDNRNIKVKTIYHLKEYLNTEIGLKNGVVFNVNYYQSEKSQLIQIADVFSNIYYSHMKNRKYYKEIQFLKKNKYLLKVFNFPNE